MNRTLLLVLTFAALSAHAQTGPAEAYVARAREQALWRDDAWLRLGHYLPTFTGGFKSQADGREFFVAPEGKTNPEAELEHTLRAFFHPEDPSAADPMQQHALCRFPARRELLARRLGIPDEAFPSVKCERLDAFVTRVAAKSVTFTFSGYYIGNPSSVFGHTLLRLNKELTTRDGKQRELLDWGINYAGEVDTNNPVLYAVKGLAGMFRGSYAHMPYYYKVREYNDFESRDLWEYRLALTDDEVRRLVLHLWELGGTYFDYYYVDENCSWHLLTALEAAAPRLELTRHLKPTVLPSDAAKALFATPGLVTEVRYRPSLRTQFQSRAAVLDAAALSAVRALEADPKYPLDGRAPEQQAQVLDAAMDYLDLVYAKDLVFDRNPEASKRRHALFARRAKLGIPSPELPETLPREKAPHLSHGTSRMGMRAGMAAGGAFAEYSFRALLHDLIDPPAGYPPHTRLELSPLRLRYAVEQGRVTLEDWQLFRVANHAPASRFEQNASWTLQLGARTVRDGGCDGCLVGSVAGSAGVSVEPFEGSLLLYLMAGGELAAGPGLPGLFGTAVRPTLGPKAGLRWHLGQRYSTLFTVGADWHFEPLPRFAWTLGSTHRVHVSEGFSLELDVRRQTQGWEASAAALFYY